MFQTKVQEFWERHTVTVKDLKILSGCIAITVIVQVLLSHNTRRLSLRWTMAGVDFSLFIAATISLAFLAGEYRRTPPRDARARKYRPYVLSYLTLVGWMGWLMGRSQIERFLLAKRAKSSVLSSILS